MVFAIIVTMMVMQCIISTTWLREYVGTHERSLNSPAVSMRRSSMHRTPPPPFRRGFICEIRGLKFVKTFSKFTRSVQKYYSSLCKTPMTNYLDNISILTQLAHLFKPTSCATPWSHHQRQWNAPQLLIVFIFRVLPVHRQLILLQRGSYPRYRHGVEHPRLCRYARNIECAE